MKNGAVTSLLVGFLVCSLFYALRAMPPRPATPLLHVTAKLSQVSGQSIVTCTVKDSRGRAVPSQKYRYKRPLHHKGQLSPEVKEDKRARPCPLSICTVEISQDPADIGHSCVRCAAAGGVSPIKWIKRPRPTTDCNPESQTQTIKGRKPTSTATDPRLSRRQPQQSLRAQPKANSYSDP